MDVVTNSGSRDHHHERPLSLSLNIEARSLSKRIVVQLKGP